MASPITRTVTTEKKIASVDVNGATILVEIDKAVPITVAESKRLRKMLKTAEVIIVEKLETPAPFDF